MMEHYIPPANPKWKPLDPEARVFGNEKNGFFVISPYKYGSHWIMVANEGKVRVSGNLESILSHKVAELFEEPNAKSAKDIWPETYDN